MKNNSKDLLFSGSSQKHLIFVLKDDFNNIYPDMTLNYNDSFPGKNYFV
jgi:hypothetical protein